MNIKQAKECIKDTVRLYLKKDDLGEYVIPVVRQRPIFMLGAPGIGKTAIMEQISQELGIALVSYSMTHHTRQSALGLPVISTKVYENMAYNVSEYTMSEIIASIYDVMRDSKIKEGILFLDEINCVSETLAPSMLLFLQYKVFGKHQVPEGWVIVTAGNPPEYNKSVREFDVVTLDRMKILEVDADYEAFKQYANEARFHGAIRSYLDMNKEDFYKVSTSVRGKNYVTARGWEDLSTILTLYEEENLSVTEDLVGQYLRDEKICREFTAYYDIYCKYRQDYKVEEILRGASWEEAAEKLRGAKFDERLSLMGLLIDRLKSDISANMEGLDLIREIQSALKALKQRAEEDRIEVGDYLTELARNADEKMSAVSKAGALSDKMKRLMKKFIIFFDQTAKQLRIGGGESTDEDMLMVKSIYEAMVNDYKSDTEVIETELHNAFNFVYECFSDDNEMLILLTECTSDSDISRFIGIYGSEEYKKYSADMMVSQRNDVILEKIEALDI